LSPILLEDAQSDTRAARSWRYRAEARGISAASLQPPPGPAPSEARGTPAASVNRSFDSTRQLPRRDRMVSAPQSESKGFASRARPKGVVAASGHDPIHPQRRARRKRRRAVPRPFCASATRRVPDTSFSLVFSHGSTRSHRVSGRPSGGPSPSGGPIGWSYRIGCFARAGRPEFPCPCNFGA